MSEVAAFEKQNFYVTFGQKYLDTPHPHYAKATPDGWVRIVSSSYKKARQKAFDLFSIYFSSIYTEQANWCSDSYSKGELEVIEID